MKAISINMLLNMDYYEAFEKDWVIEYLVGRGANKSKLESLYADSAKEAEIEGENDFTQKDKDLTKYFRKFI